jgi:hypothetical protein
MSPIPGRVARCGVFWHLIVCLRASTRGQTLCIAYRSCPGLWHT